jgi:hypothetical protein
MREENKTSGCNMLYPPAPNTTYLQHLGMVLFWRLKEAMAQDFHKSEPEIDMIF